MKQKIKTLELFKNCTCCGEEKDYSQFRKQSSSKNGVASYCIDCVKEKYQTKYDNDPIYRTKVQTRAYRWQQKNKEKHTQNCKNFIKIYSKKPWCRIPSGLRKRLKKYTNFKSPIGIKTKDLKIYLESLFLPDMTWDNYGKIWQIEKIKPIKDFNLNDVGEVAKINHYTNLKPTYTYFYIKNYSTEKIPDLPKSQTEI